MQEVVLVVVAVVLIVLAYWYHVAMKYGAPYDDDEYLFQIAKDYVQEKIVLKKILYSSYDKRMLFTVEYIGDGKLVCVILGNNEPENYVCFSPLLKGNQALQKGTIFSISAGDYLVVLDRLISDAREQSKFDHYYGIRMLRKVYYIWEANIPQRT